MSTTTLDGLPALPPDSDTCECWSPDRERPHLMSRVVAWPGVGIVEPCAVQYSNGTYRPHVFVEVVSDFYGENHQFHLSREAAAELVANLVAADARIAEALDGVQGRI